MTNFKVAAVVVALLAAAGAQACDQREYAQYQDRAKTKSGQRILAIDYCGAKAAFDSYLQMAPQLGARASQEAERCRLEMSKMHDALLSARAYDSIEYTKKTCPMSQSAPAR